MSLPRTKSRSIKLGVDLLRMVTGSKPTNEDHQWELMLFGLGLEIKALSREVIVADQRLLSYTKSIVLAWRQGWALVVVVRHDYQWGSVLSSYVCNDLILS